jgi:signal transduction histidine kinase
VKPGFSLRGRVLLGAFLWTAGLFAVTGVVTTQVMFYRPDAPRILHRLFAHSTILSALALAFMIAGLFQVRGVLSAVNRLRGRLTAVHDGHEPRVAGTYPAEVQPLVDELNTLLAHQQRAVTRAVARAGDLAHGLKTPLAVLSHEAERAAAAGHTAIAGAVREQVERMRRQVESHLAHARAAASGATPGARCPVIESVEGLARTMLRLHAERGLSLDVRVANEHVVRCRREDLDEMLGNLLDNACKWGKARVSVSSMAVDSAIVIQVDDDGAGIDPSMRAVVLQRGVRADEAAPGSGLGLAIVRDLAELYGGTIALHRATSGGLRADLRLPAAQPTHSSS